MGRGKHNSGNKSGGKAKAMKYLIKADLKVNGNVQRKDIIGAIMGQTEGLLGKMWSCENCNELLESVT